MATQILSCPVCKYPITAEYVGQQSVCAYCGEKVEAISQGVTIPTPFLVGIIAFGLGVFLGPALLASTKGGSKWLEEQARRKTGA